MTNQTNEAIYMGTEVPARIQRRRFTAAYKHKILEQAEQCSAPGEIGSLLRREGLYSSHLTCWRRAMQKGALAGLSKKRGPIKKKKTAEAKEIERLVRENKRLKEQLRRAAVINDVQKKVSDILGIDLNHPENEEND